jgi:hypothetical protein
MLERMDGEHMTEDKLTLDWHFIASQSKATLNC